MTDGARRNFANGRAFSHSDRSCDKWIAVFDAYGAYFDESGTHQASPVCAMAGYIAPAHDWFWFSREWRAALREDGVPIVAGDSEPFFHAVKCDGRYRGSQYEAWSEDRCNLHRQKLASIINRRGLVAIGTAVVVEDYKRVFLPQLSPELQEVFAKPYMFCFSVCLEKIGRHLKEIGISPGEQIAPFFDQNTEMAKTALEFYRKLIDFTPLSTLFTPVHFDDKKKRLPLQAADYAAYESFRHVKAQVVERSGVPERAQFAWLDGLRGGRGALSFGWFAEKSLAGCIQNMKRRGQL